ncbi:hypothetical protein FDP22_00865 [Paroceanicella profunda]|uniref:Uncharacterized protein n=1 Tax=Paroceanicella profunda TaxID=2579971 RepID=A0A5B8FVF9_9RHOB|nr:hypothetical protein [Paroceanicella profunda]QDL90469.1 hypothetical protein FDP22_00865 [Paroceanicella profunda]
MTRIAVYIFGEYRDNGPVAEFDSDIYPSVGDFIYLENVDGDSTRFEIIEREYLTLTGEGTTVGNADFNVFVKEQRARGSMNFD